MTFSEAPLLVRQIILVLLTAQVAMGLALLTMQIFEAYSVLRLLQTAFTALALYVTFQELLRMHLGDAEWDCPLWAVAAVQAILLMLEAVILTGGRRWANKHITPHSIREGLRVIPAGYACMEADGDVLLRNRQMRDLTERALGERGQSPAAFLHLMEGSCELPGVHILLREDRRILMELEDGSAWDLQRKEFEVDGRTLTELRACDITEENRMRRELQEKQEVLKRVNRRLRETNQAITQMTVEKELLRAKRRIHDDLGRSIYALLRAVEDPEGTDPAPILEDWRQNVRLIARGGADRQMTSVEESLRTAKLLGVACEIEGALPEEPGLQEVIASAIAVHAANVCAHAKGDLARIRCEEREEDWVLTLTNNGKAPESEITEGGGLRNLRALTEAAGGSMTIRSLPAYELQLVLRKGNKEEQAYEG